MRKLFRYPFLCFMALTIVAVMPSAWRQLGLLPPRQPRRAILAEIPEIRFPAAPEPLPEPPPMEEEPSLEELPPEDSLPPQPPEDPFTGALFIGDSRTEGIRLYSGITEADFFSSTGMSVYTVFEERLDAGGLKKCTLNELLTEKQYQRIFLMLGINELGYKIEETVQTYSETVATLQELQPEAYIIIQANLHLAKKRSDSDKTFNNNNLNQLNQAISQLADGKTIFFIDVNPIFDDENGYLTEAYTWDSVHILGKYYSQWADWLRENTPV